MVNVLGLPQHLARRGYQDYLSWANYLRQCDWEGIKAKPYLAGEIIVTVLHALGLRNPSEQTSASIASGAAAAEHGEHVNSLSTEAMNLKFMNVKAQSLFQGEYIAGRRSSRLQPQEVARIGDGREAKPHF